jgi:hypothetical protein
MLLNVCEGYKVGEITWDLNKKVLLFILCFQDCTHVTVVTIQKLHDIKSQVLALLLIVTAQI